MVFAEAARPGAKPFSLVVEGAHARLLEPWVGKDVVLGIRPEDLDCRTPNSGPGTRFSATLDVVEPMGAETYFYLNSGTHSFIARSEKFVETKPGQCVEVSMNLSRAVFFELADKSGFKTKDRAEFDFEKWQAACKRIV
jgi:multiple sugar transport system ATP-binding protein